MNTTKRMIQMILRGKTDQFKTIMVEELAHRSSVLLEKLYKNMSKDVLSAFILDQKQEKNEPKIIEKKEEIKNNFKFIPETTYYLKDGNLGVLNDTEKELISKLYEKLNNINKERMVKLLSESKESFNRVLNLAKIENKK